MPAIKWLSVNPATGLPIAELPGLRCESTLTTMMGTSGGTVNVSLPTTDRLPSNWRVATEPHRAVLVAQFDDPQETVLWAGVPVVREYGSGPEIALTLLDAHGYMDMVHQSFTQTFTQWELFDLTDFIIRRGMEDYRAKTTDSAIGGPLTDFVWPADESAYQALTRLAEAGGVEWTLEWRWEIPTAETEWGFTRRLWMYTTYGERIGRQASATTEPYLFSQVDWTRTDDWTNGRAADQVVAIGQAAGDDTPPIEAWPTFVWPPGAQMRVIDVIHVGDTDGRAPTTAELVSAAKARHAELGNGTRVYDVELVVADSDILLGRDVAIGDDVLVDLVNPDLPDLDEAFPARMVGWTAEPDPESGQIVKLKPILVEREA